MAFFWRLNVFGNGFAVLVTPFGTPWTQDTHAPMRFAGRKCIRPGRYDHKAAVVDIAPTLALILQTRPPSGSEGRSLSEVLAP